MIPKKDFKETLKKMLRLSATRLPRDIKEKLEEAKGKEENETAKEQLNNILKNLKIAEEKEKPLCQDTGTPIFFIKKPTQKSLNFNLGKTVKEAVEESTEEIPLRPNIVDPLSRKNLETNTGLKHPIIHLIPSKSTLQVETMLKGGGSENWSKLFMLNPTASEEEIVQKITNFLKEAGGQFCPPGIIGIGIGGTADYASFLAKKSLLNPLDKSNDSKNLGELEEKITEKVNDIGSGPMGLGGNTTILGTNVEKAGCHTASLPLGINLQCWAARRSKARMIDDELTIEVPK